MEPTEKYSDFIASVFNRYATVEAASLSQFLHHSRVSLLSKGSLLLRVGQVSKEIHILIQGIVASYYLDDEGNQYHKNIFLEGAFVGSMVSALKNKPSQFALEVVEEATLISLSYEKYRELINTSPDFKDFYIAYLEKNWVIDKEQREIAIVMQEASERYLHFINTHPGIEKRVPLHYIASHLGITPTQLSRIRKKIKENQG